MLESFFQLFHDSFDIERVKKDALIIHEYEKSLSYSGFECAAVYCENRLHELHLDDVERIPLVCDGKTKYMDAVMPRAWELSGRSFLKLISDSDEPGDTFLSDTKTILNSALIWSPPTPKEGVETELIELESLHGDFSGARGKLILVTGSLWRIYGQLAHAGATGIVSADPECDDCPDDIHWTNAIGTVGWYPTRDDPVLPVWFVTPCKYWKIKSLLAKGSLLIHAEMATREYDGTIDTVTGLLRGKSPEEIVILAHLYEPFVCDNAVSAAAIMEILRKIEILQKEYSLPCFEKSIRVIFSMEYFGFAQYFEQKQKTQNILCVLNLDSFCHRTLSEAGIPARLNASPMSVPFFGEWILRELLTGFTSIPFEEHYGTLSDDNFCSDSMLGIPSVLLFTPPGKYHHNTHKKFMMPDWVLCEKMMNVFAAYITILSSARTACPNLVPIILQNAQREYDVVSSHPAFFTDFQRKRILSMNRFWPNSVTAGTLDAQFSRVDSPPQKTNKHPEVYKRTKNWLPMSLADIPPVERRQWTELENLYLALALCDGKRTLGEIFSILAYFEKKALSATRERDLRNYFEYLNSKYYLEKTCK